MLRAAFIAFLLSSAAFAGENGRALSRADLAVLDFAPGGIKTLGDVTRKLGQAASWHTGDASESENKVCYVLASEPAPMYLVFGSSGEMASPKGQVNTIKLLSSLGAGASNPPCARLTYSGALTVANGLRLGMAQDRVQKLLGAGSLGANGGLEYSTCRQVPFAKGSSGYKTWLGNTGCFRNPTKPHYDDCLSIKVEFTAGKTSTIQVAGNQSVC